MKKVILNIVLLLVTTCMANAQSNGVTFLPGLGESQTIWSGMSSELKQQFEYNYDTKGFNGFDPITMSSSSLNIPSNNVVVAHSQGGLVARKYLNVNNNSPSDIKALVTVGTPHKGAPIINATLNGTVSSIFEYWIRSLAVGFHAYYGTGLPFQSEVIGILASNGLIEGGKFLLEDYVVDNFRNQAGVNDMKPGSNFLSQLNSQPENTLPPARYAIYGSEQFQTPWHLLGSLVSGEGTVENKIGIKVHNALLSYYGYLTNIAFGTAQAYKYLRDRAKENHNFIDYLKYKEAYIHWKQVAHALDIGYDSLAYGQQYLWSRYVTGSLTDSGWEAEDGILGRETQAPAFIDKPDNIERRLSALNVNHLEETAHPNVKERLVEVLGNPDVDISEVGEADDPLSVTISGPGYANDGQTITFYANVEEANGTIDYQWYHRQEPYASWVQGGTSSSFSHTFSSAPGGETAESAVKVVVTSDGETASEIHSVDVSGCQGSGSLSQSDVSTNVIIPC